MSVVDSIKLGRVSVALVIGEMSCGSTGCLSCQEKQSTSVLLVSSLDGSFSTFASDLFLQLAMDVSVADARNVFRQGTGVKGVGAGVVMAGHSGLGGMGGKNTIVTLLVAWIKP